MRKPTKLFLTSVGVMMLLTAGLWPLYCAPFREVAALRWSPFSHCKRSFGARGVDSNPECSIIRGLPGWPGSVL